MLSILEQNDVEHRFLKY